MMWMPENVPPFDNPSAAPSTTKRSLGNSRLPREANANSVPMPPSMSIRLSVFVAPVSPDSA